MANELLIDVGLTETRVALVEDDRLVHLDLERPERDSALGAIFLGRVRRIEKGLQAAYVDIGLSRDGFLGRDDLVPVRDLPIEQRLHEGETVLVQVIRDPVGEKGVKLTCQIALPGRFLSLTPFDPAVRVTKRISQDAERMRLAAVMQSLLALADQTPLKVTARLQRRAGDRRSARPARYDGADRRSGEDRRKSMGCIVNANAEGADKTELAADLERLRARWIAIEERRSKASKTCGAPAELWREMGPVGRALRDHVGAKLDRIRVNAAQGFAEARAWLFEHAPDHVGRLERFDDPAGLFDLFDIEQDIADALSRRVALKSGGAIIFGETEALTAIDVDSGKASARGAAFEELALKINLEAAAEIARQLRLRGIGGIIVIDFLHMESAAYRAQTVNALRQALARDPAPVKVLGMSALGLVEMTRKRVGEPLSARLFDSCPTCDGDGRLPSLPAVLAELLRRAWREAASSPPGARLEIACAPDVAALLDADLRNRLERQIGAMVHVKPEAGRRRESFQVTRQGR
ncbi:MAG TPA: ribonuclease E/G [Ferrovibrio sp.]|jgi:ribonuclease G|uniref:ribonuclease E/G n=1 Tax=Ferrovibrio sp. TaxID=1917215 RepID=UPI002ED33BFE